jgi:hypothetical protein
MNFAIFMSEGHIASGLNSDLKSAKLMQFRVFSDPPSEGEKYTIHQKVNGIWDRSGGNEEIKELSDERCDFIMTLF